MAGGHRNQYIERYYSTEPPTDQPPLFLTVENTSYFSPNVYYLHCRTVLIETCILCVSNEYSIFTTRVSNIDAFASRTFWIVSSHKPRGKWRLIFSACINTDKLNTVPRESINHSAREYKFNFVIFNPRSGDERLFVVSLIQAHYLFSIRRVTIHVCSNVFLSLNQY